MKFRKYSFLFVCVLFLAFLALSASEGEFGDKGQDKQVRLEKQVKKDNSDLIKFFADKNFNEMAELYVKRGGVILSHLKAQLAKKRKSEIFGQELGEMGRN